ncbi:hypothetical protein LNKW23_29510 [Paralimibaculum aggregatum]|uniref:Class I SAM-dependent methyltransferase n=1 Tax=Paralimibaculum aggregatum TaxID=3036245 RepID=A0ABQ6LR00_9RHOB|nr:class I SAM-dependent methyltransferase [Limibaculum sp. NKW23]GMG83738.1 hypothetical protein LNKW23_29510 [Limibaculum sp. NKW23]
MPEARDSRHLRRVKRLADLLAALRETVAALAEALPTRPSARDDDTIRALAERLSGLEPGIRQTASWLRKSAEGSAEARMLAEARVSLAALPRVLAAIERMLARVPEPLFPKPVPTDSAGRRLEVLSRGFALLEVAASGNLQASGMEEYGFPFIPLDLEHYVWGLQAMWRLLVALGRAEGARYLEVGCGAGGKLILAHEFFSTVEGIEYDAGYVERAALLGNTTWPGRKVTHADALHFDRYGEFDAIYSYVPLRDPELHNTMEQRLYTQARDGTVIFAPMLRASFLHTELPRFEPGLFVKGYFGAEMQALRDEAELVGGIAPPPLPRRHRIERRNLLQPVIDRLARAGFAP